MSIAVTIYDVFAFTIPGFIYLFTLNEFLRVLEISNLDSLTIDYSKYWLPLVLLSYLTGQLMQFVSYRLWIKFWHKTSAEIRAYNEFRTMCPEENVEFNPKQWPLLSTVIRRIDRATAEMNDKNMALSIMLRNVSFGLFLFGLLNLYTAFFPIFSLQHLLTAFCMMIFSYFSLKREDYYGVMHYRIIFQHALYYGKNLPEIITAIRKTETTKKQSKS
jgi:hypothetical protein